MQRHDFRRYRGTIRMILLQVATVCAIVILAASILDWFNPYMNFSGQIRPIEIIQVVDLLILTGTSGVSGRSDRPMDRSCHTPRQGRGSL